MKKSTYQSTYRIDPYHNSGIEVYGIEYLGQQQRKGKHSLDEFRDLKTKERFVRLPSEGIFDARDRSRREYLHTGKVSGMVGVVVGGE